MQGSFQQTAKICRYITELHNDNKLTHILSITSEGVQPLTTNYVKETQHAIEKAFDDAVNRSAVGSAIQKSLPAFLGVEFIPYDPTTTADASPELEARVAELEAQVADMQNVIVKTVETVEELHRRMLAFDKAGAWLDQRVKELEQPNVTPLVAR